ncbi:sulfurtransferase [Marinomonas epiphytica]
MIRPSLIQVEELASIIEQPNLVILDSRFYLTDHKKGRQEYEQGHIPTALFVDLHEQLAGPETPDSGRHPLPEETVFSNQLAAWGIDRNSQVVVYDDMGGAIAARAWWMLSQQEIHARVLDGGFPVWQASGQPISTELPCAAKVEQKIDVSFPWAITEKQVMENFETAGFQLVDARSADRFLGENETMDPVAGHIPGAINRPFTDNLTGLGVFKSVEELAYEWQALRDQYENFVYYCGSGVTACHNVLALNYAGIEAEKVYIGSWSQWAKRMLKLSKDNN